MHPGRSLLALLAVAACDAQGSMGVPVARADDVTPGTASGLAVVELFTSEGCSSCPPADAVLAEIDHANAADARQVFTLAFHVDYWDSLGWTDRFATADNTARQQAYARSFAASGVYTPQMVVDGVREFTGSDRDKAVASITRALATPATVRLAIHPRAAGANAVKVNVDVEGPAMGATLDVAVVQRAATTEVRAGENRGKTLRHTNVVRAFVTAPIAKSQATEVVVAVPPTLRREDAELIAYIQRGQSELGGMPILGAARAPMPP
jgi:hypothetical protein